MHSVEFDKVSVRYHYDEFDAISELSFCVPKGQTKVLCLGVQGGKTTVAKLIMGLISPTSGSILADGVPLESIPLRDRNIAYFCYPPLHFGGTVLKNVSYGLKKRGIGKAETQQLAEQALRRFGLSEHARTKAKKLTENQLYDLALARVTARNAEFFILDGILDADVRNKILAEASRTDATVLVLCDSNDETQA